MNESIIISNLTLTTATPEAISYLIPALVGLLPWVFILFIAYREQLTFLFSARVIAKRLSKKTGMGVIVIAKEIDEGTMVKFENALEMASAKGMKDIILILHTYGGSLFCMERIMKCIQNYPRKIHAYIPRYSMSAGTFIALSCASLHMDEKGSLGSIDPQMGILFWIHSAKAWKEVVKKKGAKANDESIAMSVYADQYTHMVRNKLDEMPMLKGLKGFKDRMVSGNLPHAMQLDRNFMKGQGLKIENIEHPEIRQLMMKKPKGFIAVM